jgi:hypothetical protein
MGVKVRRTPRSSNNGDSAVVDVKHFKQETQLPISISSFPYSFRLLVPLCSQSLLYSSNSRRATTIRIYSIALSTFDLMQNFNANCGMYGV